MCDLRECLEGIKFGPAGSIIQVGYSYIDGERFSAVIRDGRYEGGEHLHFPAADFDEFARAVRPGGGSYAPRDAQARKIGFSFSRSG